MRKGFVIILTVMLVSGWFIFSSSVKADSWTDDFTNTNLQFNARWEVGGLGQLVPFNGTYAEPVSFTTELTEGWHGPWIMTGITPAADFNVSVILDCIADADKETVGKAEIRFLDAEGDQIYSMEWHDIDPTQGDRQTVVSLKGGQDTLYLYSSEGGNNLKYTIFTGKELLLERISGTLNFYVSGTLVFSSDVSSKALGAVKLEFLKHEDICTPEFMRVDSISVRTEPASLPGQPSSPKAIAANANAFFTWSPPSDDGGLSISSYRLYRGTSSGSLQYLTTLGNVLEFNDTGLSNGQTYYYQVSAVNDMGEGPRSTEVLAMPTGLPGQPRNLQAIAGSDHVNLTWDAPSSNGGSPITAYTIYRDGSLLQNNDGLLTFTDTGLSVGIEYSYRVSASNAIGESELSSEVLATPGASQHLPMAPRDMRAVGGDAVVRLSWTPPSSNGNSIITGYSVYRGTAPGSLSVLATLDVDFDYDDGSVVNGQTYYYHVTATNGVGEGPASSEVSSIPQAPIPPSEPMFVTASAGLDQVILNWSAPLSNGGTVITDYGIYRGLDQDNLSLISTLGPVLTFTDTEAMGGQRYFYSVSAINSAGEGQLSQMVQVTPISPSPNTYDPVDEETKAGISLNSTIVTAIVMLIAVIGMLIYFKRPDKKA